MKTIFPSLRKPEGRDDEFYHQAERDLMLKIRKRKLGLDTNSKRLMDAATHQNESASAISRFSVSVTYADVWDLWLRNRTFRTPLIRHRSYPAMIPAIEQLVGNTIQRLHADAGYRGHNAPPDYKFKIYYMVRSSF